MQRVSATTLPDDIQNLVDSAANGETIVIVLDDAREVQLVPLSRKKFHRRAGMANGMITLREDFDAPIPDFEEYM
ncbi:MAG TPA: hypothetical protein VER79_07250 [Candidatus Limnocylindrales bacterium]|nr:hypothetical protein [Candidatus Limnocylindrales bacterium]